MIIEKHNTKRIDTMPTDISGATRILLVDDEPDVEGMVRLKFRKQIRKGKYDFVFAEDGFDALSKLKENPDIDIVISDINMPKMDGLTLLNHLSSVNKMLKAIIVSAYGDMDNIRTAMNRGAYDFLTKPIDFEDLAITIEKTRKTIDEVKSSLKALNKTRHSLSMSKALNHSIISSAADSIITIDDMGNIQTVNPATEQLLGLISDDIIAYNISDFFPGLREIIMKKSVEYDIDDDETTVIFKNREVDAYTSIGQNFPAELSVSKIVSESENYYTIMARDIGFRKKAENLLREYNLTLEQEVEERTRELKQLNKEKNEILGIAVHDLKNPLSGIQMIAEYLNNCDELTQEEIKEFTGDILSSTKKMFNLIKNLLDTNAIDQGKIKIEKDRFNINELLEEEVKFFRKSAAKKNIDIILSNSDGPYYVYQDSNASAQIMENLISNAIKYNPLGKKVYIQLENTDTHVIFSVRDEGPGISEEDKKKLFKKFSRLSAQPTAGENSTGLGLSIVKKLCELMNCDIRCESKLGEGTNFICKFPKA